MCMCLLHYSVLFVFLVVFGLFSCIAFYRRWRIKMNICFITFFANAVSKNAKCAGRSRPRPYKIHDVPVYSKSRPREPHL